MKKIIIIIILIFSLTGCYNHQELNDIAITTASYITKVDNKYHVTIQIANPNTKSSNSTNQPSFIVYESSGKTIHDAYYNLTNKTAKKMYFNHIQIFIIDENLAKDNLAPLIDYIMRNPEIRMEFYVLISQNSGQDILKITTPLTNLSSENIRQNLIASTNNLGISNLTTFSKLADNYLNNKIELAIPSIKINGNTKKAEDLSNLEESESNANISISNMSIFKDNKLIGYLSKEESIMYNLIMNNTNNISINYPCNKNKYVTIQLVNTHSKIIPSNNKLQITVKINGTGNISELDCDLDLTSNKTTKQISKKINQTIEKKVNKTINTILNKYQTDIFGFEDIFYKNSYQYYQNISNFQDKLKNIEINVQSNINVFAKGNGIKGVLNNE